MIKTLSKFLLPAIAGSVVVCTTMHLTNTNGGLLNSLKLLNIKNKPEVDEDELIPKIEEKQESPSPSDQSEDSGEKENDTTDDSSQESTQNTNSNPESASKSSTSTPNSSGNLTPEQAIREHAKRMIHGGLISQIGSLSTNHGIINTLENLTNALSQFAADNKVPTTEGGGGSENQ